MQLDHAEAFGAFADGNDECTFKMLVAFVVGQAELIEARVCGWQVAKRWGRR